MTSLFPFLRRRSEHDDEEPVTAPAADESPRTNASPAATAGSPPTSQSSSPAQALSSMLRFLEDEFLEGESNPVPGSSVSVVRMAERALAVGNRRGMERRSNSLALVELKGGRLEGVLRFQLWGDDMQDVEAKTATLHHDLLGARDTLWTAGFLRLTAETTSVPEEVAGIGAWRQTAEYAVLYEYQYWETDAESIIARIPIASDLEVRHSPARETTLVRDEMVRWDRDEAPDLELTAPSLSKLLIHGLAGLAYLPAGTTGGPVTLARLDRSSTLSPTTYPDLSAFHSALTDLTDPDRHAQVVFVSIAEFLDALEPAGEPIALGDWDEDGALDTYAPQVWRAVPPISLDSSDDLLSLSYADASLSGGAVVYLRAEVSSAAGS